MSCCLCLKSLPADSRRRKKLYGDSCENARQTLIKLSTCPLHSMVETRSPLAYLCWQCETMLQKIQNLEEKLDGLKENIQQMLSSLSSVRTKRPRSMSATLQLGSPSKKQLTQGRQTGHAARSLSFSESTSGSLQPSVAYEQDTSSEPLQHSFSFDSSSSLTQLTGSMPSTSSMSPPLKHQVPASRKTSTPKQAALRVSEPIFTL